MKHNKSSHPAKITPRNIWAIIQAWIRKHRFNIGGFVMPRHMYEQIIWRRTQVVAKSPMCWQSGSCIVCGCDIIGKTMEDRACSIADTPELLAKKEPCYPAMMKKKEWQDYKRIHRIKLFE